MQQSPRKQRDYLIEQLELSTLKQRDVLPPKTFAEILQVGAFYPGLLKIAR